MTSIWNEQQLSQVLGLSILLSPPGMRGEHLRYLRTMFGMTQAEMARAMNLKRRPTIAVWESRSTVFGNPGDEMLPRAILLNLFKVKIIDSEFCFLTDRQRQLFDDSLCSFVSWIPEAIRTRPRRSHLKIERRSDHWSAASLPACA